MTFAKIYGAKLGAGFAEAHHKLPLGKTPQHVKTRLEDLTTVCSNCHSMLHRMEGVRGDLKMLHNLVAKRHGTRI